MRVRVTATLPGQNVEIRRLPNGPWEPFSASRGEVFASTTIQARAVDPATGAQSPLRTADYSIGGAAPLGIPGSPDSNGNGLSDAFERTFGLTDPNGDADGDGFSNLAEQNAGTDPLDPHSRPAPPLTLAIARPTPGGPVQLSWPAGLEVTLEFSLDLQTWTPVEPPPAGNTYSEDPAGPRKLYRLRQ